MTATTAPKRRRLTARQKRMQGAIKYLSEFMASYDTQAGALDYSDKTFIDDVLYGLGVALHGTGASYAQGFDKWKGMLREHLKVAPEATSDKT